MNATTNEQAMVLELEPTQAQPLAVQQPQPLALAQNSPAAMMLAAMDRGATLEQVEKMMDLQERFERREAEKALNAALSAFRAEAIEVIKRKGVGYQGKNGWVGYKHAELSDLVDAVAPALARHGLSHRWDIQQAGNQITVTCILTHAMGHSERVNMTAGADNSGNKNPIQAIQSAITAMQRHTLKAITGVAEKGDDDDANSAAGKGEPQADLQGESETALQAHITAGRSAAMKGMVALTKWWGTLGKKEQAALGKEFTEMRKSARAADQGTDRG